MEHAEGLNKKKMNWRAACWEPCWYCLFGPGFVRGPYDSLF